MKIEKIICFLSIILIIGYATIVVESVYYVEMTPYADDACTVEKGESGVGYAFVVGECFGVGSFAPIVNNYIITLGDNNNNATFHQYQSSDNACSQANPIYDVTYQSGSCYNAPEYADNNMYPNIYNYVLVSIKENPTSMPQYAYKFTQYIDSNCATNPQWYFFYTNDTVFHYGNNDFSKFYCDEGEPYELYCEGSATNCTVNDQSRPCSRNVWAWHEHIYFLASC
ncbi:hypothetical protein RB653_002143 [Dictyostelium firmibasis]|uniref:Uncharacterized protein n=1 Tax=Dictyostelium firmibasis TaxID=79012 RepID=A0AAN7U847_9MYCE